MTILELREKRAKAWEATKAFLDSHCSSNCSTETFSTDSALAP